MPRVNGTARLAQMLVGIPAGQCLRPVDRLEGQTGLGLARHAALLVAGLDEGDRRAVTGQVVSGARHGL